MEEKKINTIKENWEKVDECCPTCNQVTKRQQGITRQNIKRLFSIKWSTNEIVFTILIILVLILAYAYKTETAQCREWIAPLFSDNGKNCISVCDMKCNQMLTTQFGGVVNRLNITNMNVTIDDTTILFP